MKHILPLVPALVAGMAQVGGNSDYRAGSDFARQIQGQGTGSIQGFKPQENILSYNTNPGETKYHSDVATGGDDGLENDGTTEWAIGETGKAITESLMNKPKDILSPDTPFIQTGRDAVDRADSIVGNTGRQCSAQEINHSESMNYICERDTIVEEYRTRTANITKDWKYTDEYREVTTPHSQFWFGMNGLKLVFSVTAPVTGTVKSTSLSVYTASFFLNSRYAFMGTTLNIGLANGQSDTYPLSGVTGSQVTQRQVLTGSSCIVSGNYLPHGNGDREAYEPLVSGASTFTLKFRMKVRDKGWVPRVEWVKNCLLNKVDGMLADTECSEPGSTKTGVMGGKPWSITQACWAYRDKYVTQSADNGTYQKYVDNPVYTLASRQYVLYSDEGACLHEYATHSCEPRTSGKVMVCGGDVSCPNGECDKAQSGKGSDFSEAVSQPAALAATGKGVAVLNGVDIKAFTGETKLCRRAAASFSNCYRDGGWSQDISLAKYNNEEKTLGKAKDSKLTASVGELCPKKVLGVCLQKRRSYCQFDSKLAQIIQQQECDGQLRIGFGGAKHLDCRGTTVDELQRIRLDKLDFTNLYEDLMKNQKTPDSGVLTQKVKEQIADQLKQTGQ